MNELLISPKAQNDLDEIKQYISFELENPIAAATTLKRITQDIRQLCDYAKIGKLLSSIVDCATDYRFLISGNYLIFYRVVENKVYVDRILYARRDYLRILLEETM